MRRAHRATWIACALFSLPNQVTIVRGSDAVVRTIAYSGMPAPGLPYLQNYVVLSLPVQNQVGDFAFRGTVSLPKHNPGSPTLPGVWKTHLNTILPVIHGAMPLPGFSESTRLVTANPLILNRHGDLLIHGSVAEPGSPSMEALWVFRDGSLELVTREGNRAPGLAPESYFDDFSNVFQDSAMDDQGTILFPGTAINSTVSPSVSTKGLWVSSREGGIQLVAQSGAPAPSFPAGCTFGTPYIPAIDELGNFYFSCAVMNSNGEPPIATEWRVQSGAAFSIAHVGQNFQGMPDGVSFGYLTACGINSAGTVVVSGRLTGPGVTSVIQDAICYGEAGSLQLVLQAGQPAPGFPKEYQFRLLGFSSRVNTINDRGEIAFYGWVCLPATPSITERGIWLGQPNLLQLVARTNTTVPGVPGARFTSFTTPYLNSKGKVAFQATIAGPGVNSANNNYEGIWGTNNDGQLKLILRTSDPVEVAPGETRLIKTIWLNSGSLGGGDARRLVFDAKGNFIVTVQFTDNSWGIVQTRATSNNLPAIP